nr:integrase, catalytic region, zinc finger, CCHC-type, peptidase aspartic, catalytic [Tanacetum cinerariifolium]
MTGNRSQLINIVSEFMDTVRFENDHIARIIGYGDYQLGNVTISRVYYVEGLGHNLFSVGQFYDADLEVAFRKNTCFIRNLKGVDLISGSRDTNLYTISLDDMLKLLRSVFFQNLQILKAGYGTVACYTRNYLLICLRYNQTPYELMQDKKPDLSFFHVFGALCYPTNDNDDLGKLDGKADIGIFVGTRLQCMNPATSSSGLVLNTISQQPCILPNRDYWDHLFQPMFDEYFNPPTIAVSLVLVAAAPRAADLADSLVSTSIDQDAPSLSTPSTQEREQSPNISQDLKNHQKHNLS